MFKYLVKSKVCSLVCLEWEKKTHFGIASHLCWLVNPKNNRFVCLSGDQEGFKLPFYFWTTLRNEQLSENYPRRLTLILQDVFGYIEFLRKPFSSLKTWESFRVSKADTYRTCRDSDVLNALIFFTRIRRTLIKNPVFIWNASWFARSV